MTTYKTFRVEMFEDVAIIRILATELWHRGEIHALQDELLAYLRADKPKRLILDMSPITRVSSEAITALLKIRDQATAADADLRLCSLQPAVKEVLTITDLTRLFHIYASLPEAFRGFAKMPTDEPWPGE